MFKDNFYLNFIDLNNNKIKLLPKNFLSYCIRLEEIHLANN